MEMSSMTKQAEPEQIAPQMTNKQLGIVGGIIAVIILIIIIIAATSNHTPKSLVDTASGKVETTTAAAIQAYINSYYVDKEYYPYDYQALIDYKPENKADLEKYQSNLKDFEYSRRGDEQAYQFKYTNIDDKEIILKGNYKEDYR